MGFVIAGAVLLVAVIGVFYLKDHFRKPWLARLAYHELTMRLVVVAAALMIFGGLIAIGEFFE